MSSGGTPNASRLRTSWRATSRRASAPPRALELVDRHHVGEVEHVDLLQLRRGAELGRHHVQRDVDEGTIAGVALADARRLHDRPGRTRPPGRPAMTSAEVVGHSAPRPRVASERKNTCSPSSAFIRIRSPEQRAAAAPPGRVDRQHRDAQLVLLVDAEPPDQLVGQRRLARAAGAGDAEHGHRAGRPRPRPAPCGRRRGGGRPAGR